MLVAHMEDQGDKYQLKFPEVLRGPGRQTKGVTPDFTSMLGLGHIPSLAALYRRLGAEPDGDLRTLAAPKDHVYKDFQWGVDP